MPAAPGPDHYEVLGVARTASEPEVRAGFLRQARRHHPDRSAGADAATRAEAERRMRQVNEAWSVLGDVDRRRGYDELLATVPVPPRWRPDGGANPDFVPVDGDEDDDLPDADATAWTATWDESPDGGATLPRWLQLAPPSIGALALATVVVGFVTALGPLVGFGLLLGAVALAGFVAMPLVAFRVGSRPRG